MAELESCTGISPGYGRSRTKRTENHLMCVEVLKGIGGGGAVLPPGDIYQSCLQTFLVVTTRTDAPAMLLNSLHRTAPHSKEVLSPRCQ